jgi:hypothetical protein
MIPELTLPTPDPNSKNNSLLLRIYPGLVLFEISVQQLIVNMRLDEILNEDANIY